jgi:hypothetical protein
MWRPLLIFVERAFSDQTTGLARMDACGRSNILGGGDEQQFQRYGLRMVSIGVEWLKPLQNAHPSVNLVLLVLFSLDDFRKE